MPPSAHLQCLERHLAVVVVGFPATPLLLSRARICISAAHSRKDLAAALHVLHEVVDLLGLRYAGAGGNVNASSHMRMSIGGGGADGAFEACVVEDAVVEAAPAAEEVLPQLAAPAAAVTPVRRPRGGAALVVATPEATPRTRARAKRA